MQSPSSGQEVVREFPTEGNGVARLQFELVEEMDPRCGMGERAEAVAALKKEVLVLEERLKQQAATMPGKIEDAKTLARLLARRDWEQEMEQRIAEDRAMVRKACEEFERERTRYFAAVEGQVVKLSLAIAARVLYREAKMDPLLLSAAVRVALEKVEDQSETRLKVPISEVALWKEVFETGKADSVKVLGEECMTRGECVLETSVGTVELGIEAQLGEIERGFFDLMKKRPA